jgi:hypothetical protein
MCTQFPDNSFYHLCLSEITQLFFFFFYCSAICAICAQRAPNTHTSRSRPLRRPVPSLYSRASRSSSRSAHADPHNLCPFPQMSFCTNLGFNRSSPSGANAGYVVLCACLRAHQCSLAIADHHNFFPLSQ